MGIIIAIAACLFQIFCTCALATILWFLIKCLLGLMKIKMSKSTALICLAVIFVVLCAVLAYVCENPVVICPDEYTDIVTDEQMRNVQSIASGVYSKNLPLIPVLARIETVQWQEEHNSYEIKFQINYFFFGNVKMVIGGDGIGVVKPLGRQ